MTKFSYNLTFEGEKYVAQAVALKTKEWAISVLDENLQKEFGNGIIVSWDTLNSQYRFPFAPEKRGQDFMGILIEGLDDCLNSQKLS